MIETEQYKLIVGDPLNWYELMDEILQMSLWGWDLSSRMQNGKYYIPIYFKRKEVG